jgi:Flp pilus assembly protein TadG
MLNRPDKPTDELLEMIPRARRPSSPKRGGYAAIYTLIMLTALFALASLGVDVGRVQVAKAELQTAADAAARAAASAFSNGASQAATAAKSIAAANTCDGVSVALDESQDIEFGTWDSHAKTFTSLAGSAQSSANAIRVTARRQAARNNAIPLTFARIVGKQTCDVRAVAIVGVATSQATAPAFVGIDSVKLWYEAFFASYHSTSGSPGGSNSFTNGSIASNGEIDLKSNAVVNGNVILGPNGSFAANTNSHITGIQQRLPSPLSYPPATVGTANVINNNLSIGLTNKGRSPLSGTNFSLKDDEKITIGGGTYYFTAITLGDRSTVTFTGPATLYVNGHIYVDNKSILLPYANRPANLAVKVIGTRIIGLTNDVPLCWDLYAPQSYLLLDRNVDLAGRAVAKNIFGSYNVRLFYDETLTPSSGGSSSPGSITLLK